MRRKTYKYFADMDGETIELTSAHPMKNAEFNARWPGIAGIRYDSFNKWVGMAAAGRERGIFPITRMIAYQSSPSLHECNAKCMGGNPRGTCECKCGGANHGRG